MKIFSCNESRVIVNCPTSLSNGTVHDECAAKNETVPCDVAVDDTKTLRCKEGTLLSTVPVVCTETTDVSGLNPNGTVTVLKCEQKDLLPDAAAARIPTTTQTPPPPVEKTEEDLSFMAKVHLFFLRLVGKGEETKKIMTTPRPETTTLAPDAWVPLPLTIPPEPLENTTDITAAESTTESVETTTTVQSKVLSAMEELSKELNETSTKKTSTTVSKVDAEDDYFEK